MRMNHGYKMPFPCPEAQYLHYLHSAHTDRSLTRPIKAACRGMRVSTLPTLTRYGKMRELKHVIWVLVSCCLFSEKGILLCSDQGRLCLNCPRISHKDWIFVTVLTKSQKQNNKNKTNKNKKKREKTSKQEKKYSHVFSCSACAKLFSQQNVSTISKYYHTLTVNSYRFPSSQKAKKYHWCAIFVDCLCGVMSRTPDPPTKTSLWTRALQERVSPPLLHFLSDKCQPGLQALTLPGVASNEMVVVEGWRGGVTVSTSGDTSFFSMCLCAWNKEIRRAECLGPVTQWMPRLPFLSFRTLLHTFWYFIVMVAAIYCLPLGSKPRAKHKFWIYFSSVPIYHVFHLL